MQEFFSIVVIMVWSLLVSYIIIASVMISESYNHRKDWLVSFLCFSCIVASTIACGSFLTYIEKVL